MNQNPLTDVLEFMVPYDDELYVVFINETTDKQSESIFKKQINKIRNSIPDILPKPIYNTYSTSELFRAKANDILNTKNCLIIIDPEFSYNIIQYILNKLTDKMEGMLIDKFLLQVPQDKFIFDVSGIDDLTLDSFLTILELKYSSFTYYMAGNHLAVWVLSIDEFTSQF